MPNDPYGAQDDTVSSSSLDPSAVTPSDNTDLPVVSKALWVGTGGDVRLKGVNGQPVVFVGVPSGFIIPVRASRVYATGTTATDIVAL